MGTMLTKEQLRGDRTLIINNDNLTYHLSAEEYSGLINKITELERQIDSLTQTCYIVNNEYCVENIDIPTAEVKIQHRRYCGMINCDCHITNTNIHTEFITSE